MGLGGVRGGQGGEIFSSVDVLLIHVGLEASLIVVLLGTDTEALARGVDG